MVIPIEDKRKSSTRCNKCLKIPSTRFISHAEIRKQKLFDWHWQELS